jgi:hypothetical protein
MSFFIIFSLSMQRNDSVKNMTRRKAAAGPVLVFFSFSSIRTRTTDGRGGGGGSVDCNVA